MAKMTRSGIVDASATAPPGSAVDAPLEAITVTVDVSTFLGQRGEIGIERGCQWSPGVSEMVNGQCLCGKVRFVVSGNLGEVRLCYCELCRRANGTAFSANARVPKASYQLLSGTDVVREYESSPGVFRAFCSICGSPVFARVNRDPEFIRVRLGTLTQNAEATITAHVWVHGKPSWYAIHDALPQHQDGARAASS
jgi:hypothetical protein